MPPSHPARGASRALLDAALGGLLGLSVSCGPSDDVVPPDAAPEDDAPMGGDSGGGADAGTMHDAGGARDAGGKPDAGTAKDGGTVADGSVAADAGSASDAGGGMDAAPGMDGGSEYDASWLFRGDAICDVVADRVILSSDASPGLTLEEFTAMCAELGGYIEIHPHCGGNNSCRGISYDSGTGILTDHTCAGLNTCAGFSCVVP